MAFRKCGQESRAMQIGYKLAAEAYGPGELVRQAVTAERAGFDVSRSVTTTIHGWATKGILLSPGRCLVPSRHGAIGSDWQRA